MSKPDEDRRGEGRKWRAKGALNRRRRRGEHVRYVDQQPRKKKEPA